MKINGYTDTGRPVVGDSFALVDTHGVPMFIVLDDLYKRGFRHDWLDFILQAIGAGWNVNTAFGKCREGVEEAFHIPRDDKPEIIARLKHIREHIIDN